MRTRLRFAGVGVTEYAALGEVVLLRGQDRFVSAGQDGCAGDPEREAARLREALQKSRAQLERILETAAEENQEILAVQLDFLDDPAFREETAAIICSGGKSAACAVREIGSRLSQAFLAMTDDPYMQERSADVQDVTQRILANLSGDAAQDGRQAFPENAVVVADDLFPSTTACLPADKIAGFVIQKGGVNCHTAIMARNMGIAAVVHCEGIAGAAHTGDAILLDGTHGEAILHPDQEDIARYERGRAEAAGKKEQAEKARFASIFRDDGRRVLVTANIGTLEEARLAKENGADGIGLFRTEFLFMNHGEAPTEQEQFEAYRQAAKLFAGSPVIIRTLDAGGDKQIPYLSRPKEENPYLGLRAIRLCLREPGLFKAQIRAILRAAVYGDLRVMLPMISCREELEQGKAYIRECAEELRGQEIPCQPQIKLGMMVEIPAAAACAELFAPHVDFFSIGTNDLIQYALAADRGNSAVAHLYDGMHPGVWKLIAHTVKAACRQGIPCYMCGELASDAAAIPRLYQLGLDEFSVSPQAVGRTKHLLLQQGKAEPF